MNGATIPLVNFDVGPSWSGLIPISSAANETRKVRSLETLTDDGFNSLISPVVLLVLSSRSRRKFR